jgi:hypothetical protein
VGVPTYPLGFVMGGILLAGAVYWLAYVRPRRAAAGASGAAEAGAGGPALAPAAGPAAAGAEPERARPPLDDVPAR